MLDLSQLKLKPDQRNVPLPAAAIEAVPVGLPLSPVKFAVLEKNGYQGSSVPCPHCGQAADFQGYRAKTPVSVRGPIPCPRAYYSCHRCGHGLAPWDDQVGLTPKRLTPAAEELVAMAGAVCNSFAEAAAKVLP